MNQAITLSGNQHAFSQMPALPPVLNIDMDDSSSLSKMIKSMKEFEITAVSSAEALFNTTQLAQVAFGAVKAGSQMAQGNLLGAGFTLVKEGLKYGAGEMVEDTVMDFLSTREDKINMEDHKLMTDSMNTDLDAMDARNQTMSQFARMMH